MKFDDASELKKIFKANATAYDFPEDYDNENGMYEHYCYACDHMFYGDKGRRFCKVCNTKAEVEDGKSESRKST
jgi:hypothetical protein